jgi:hypothetical protein
LNVEVHADGLEGRFAMAALTSARGAVSSFIDGLRTAVDRPDFHTQPRSDRVSRARATPWGDGIDEAGWRDVARVADLQLCSPDEYIRVFPRCARAPYGSVPTALRIHLAYCVAARAERLGPFAPGLKSLSAREVKSETRYGNWFGDGPQGGQSDSRESDMLLFADNLLWRVKNDAVGRFSEKKAASIAFVTGIHPFYFWPETLPSHERFTAIGWLGYLNRGRRAYMPIDIAQYFVDVIQANRDGQLLVRDASAAFFLDHAAAVAEVYRVAALRLKGVRVPTKRLGASSAPGPCGPVSSLWQERPYVTFVGPALGSAR